MKLSQSKQLIATLGGFAVLAGAGYYLYRRNLRNKAANTISFQSFKELFLVNKLENLSQLQQQFDVLFYREVGQYSQNLQNKGSNKDELSNPQNQRYCGKAITFGYRCYDCYPENQFAKEDNVDLKQSQTFESILLHAVCEDCFDEQIHKDHVYDKERFNILTYCDCGVSGIYKESSFCAEHCGFKLVKKEYTEEFPEDLKSKLNSFFDNFISFLIDVAESESSSKLGSTHSQLNILFNFILNLILQLIKENSVYAFFFQDFLKKPFGLPNKIDTRETQKLTFLSLGEQVENKEISTLDILFMLFNLMNESTVSLLTQIFREIGSADFTFYSDIAVRYQRYNYIVLGIFLDSEKCLKNPDLLMRIIDLYGNIVNGTKTHEQRKKVFLDNEEDFSKLSKMHLELTKRFKFEENGIAQVQSCLQFCYCVYITSLWMCPSIFNNSKYILEHSQELVNQQILFADVFYLGGSQLSFAEDFASRELSLYLSAVVQLSFSAYFFEFMYILKKRKDFELCDKIRKLLSENYLKQVDKIYEDTYKFESSLSTPRYHMGINLLYFIIFIVILDNQPFNREGLVNIIKGNFPSIQTDEEICKFADKVLHLLKNYIPQSGHNVGLNQTPYVTLRQTINNNCSEIWSKEQQIFWEAQYMIYDYYILTFQIFMLLGSPPERSLFEEAYDEDIQLQDNKFLSFQVIFDQTPLLNVLVSSEFKFILQPDDQQIATNIKKAFQSTLLGVIQIQLRTPVNNHQILEEETAKFLTNKKLIKSELAELCDVTKGMNQFKLKDQQLSKNVHLFNQGRMYQTVETPYMKYYYQNLNYMIQNQKFYLDMFDHQKQLFIREYAYYTYFDHVLARIKLSDDMFHLSIWELNEQIISFSVLIEMSQDVRELFTEEEYQETQQIEEKFYSESGMNFLIQKYKTALVKLGELGNKREDFQLFLDSYEATYKQKYQLPIVEKCSTQQQS